MSIFLALITLITSQAAFALTQVTASVDSNPVMSNESIVLTVIADDSVERDALDTASLLTDFIVARTEVSSQTSMVNFSTTRTTRWQIVLIPRSVGKLTIPALSIDGYQSQPISIDILEQNNTRSTQQQDIFVSAELSSSDVYVQQLVTLTIKLHVGVQLQRGSLTEPTLAGATIEQVGKDKESEDIVNGKRYRIIERTYAITPEQSGELTLVTPMFSGDIMVQSKRRSGFLSFGETKPVNVLGDKLTLKVRPIPVSFPIDANNSWLPSELLTLHEEWQPEPSEFKVGEPITRTITLTAAGLGKAQLPKIIMDAPIGLKVYPDQAELHSSLTKDRLISQKRQNFALVASHSGEFTLPKITIPWWNTVTNKYQQAILPEQKILVKSSENGSQNPTTADTSVNPINNNSSANIVNKPLLQNQPMIIEKQGYLQWLFLALWLLTTLAWFVHVIYLKRAKTKNKKPLMKKTVNSDYLALMAACKKNNAEQSFNLLLPWLSSLTSNEDSLEITTLSQAISQINNKDFTAAINDVQQHLYGKTSSQSDWNGNFLLDAIVQVNAQGIQHNASANFTLNPN
jgi:hypothetical protein